MTQNATLFAIYLSVSEASVGSYSGVRTNMYIE